MAPDYSSAGIVVGHNIHILRDVAQALIQGWYCDANEHRHIAASKGDIELVSLELIALLSSINKTETAKQLETTE
jgi:hypothetical protein